MGFSRKYRLSLAFAMVFGLWLSVGYSFSQSSFIPRVFAKDVQSLVQMGFPSLNKNWTAQDYKTTHLLLKQKRAPLFNFRDEGSRQLFLKMTDPNNLRFVNAKNIPSRLRLQQSAAMLSHANQIMLLYVPGGVPNKRYEKEIAWMMVFLSQNAIAIMKAADEFIPTIPKNDPQYDARMRGFKKMNGGLKTMLDGFLTSTSENTFYSAESILHLLKHLNGSIGSYGPLLSDRDKAGIISNLASWAEKTPNPQIKNYFLGLKYKIENM